MKKCFLGEIAVDTAVLVVVVVCGCTQCLSVECFLSTGSSLWPLHAAAVVCHVAGRFQLLLRHRTDVSSVYCTCQQNISDCYFCWVECLRCLFWPCFKLPCGIITAKWNVFCRCTVVKADKWTGFLRMPFCSPFSVDDVIFALCVRCYTCAVMIMTMMHTVCALKLHPKVVRLT